jgi:hypothetical protein
VVGSALMCRRERREFRALSLLYRVGSRPKWVTIRDYD